MYNIIEQLSDDSFLYLQPWFYNNQLALRCELGIGEDKYMENAFSRAIQIASILFENRKIDAAFRRFLTTGKKNVRVELFFLALGFNLKKRWMKQEKSREKTHYSEKKAA